MTGTVTAVTDPKTMRDQMARLKAAVVAQLEAAGSTLLALPNSGHGTGMRTGGLDFVREAIEAYGWTDAPVRPARPAASAITRMDEALGWLSLLPPREMSQRKIVGCRMLVHPVTGRHLYSWRRIGLMLAIEHKTAQSWHTAGIEAIVTALIARTGND